MAATPEVKVKSEIKKLLKEQHVYYAMPIGSAFGNSGVPDFLCCVNGYFLAIEAKANGGKPTALQKKHLTDIDKAGGYALVVDNNNLDYLASMIKALKGMR
jgi:pantoate kinase